MVKKAAKKKVAALPAGMKKNRGEKASQEHIVREENTQLFNRPVHSTQT